MSSPYLTGSSSHGSPYLTGSPTGGGSAYLGGSTGGKKQKQPGFINRFASDLYHAALNMPAGVFHLAEAPVLDTVDFVKHPWSHPTKTHSGEALIGMAKGTKETLQHPLRHPGLTALTLLPVGEGIARAGEATAVARAGGSAAEVARTAVGRSEPAPLTLRHEGLEVKVPAARSALGRAGQRAHVRVLEQRPGMMARRVGRELHTERRVHEAVERGPAVSLIAAGRKLKPHEQTALRIVAEGVPSVERIGFHRHRAETAKTSLLRKRHEQKAALIEQARPLLDETRGKPRLSAGQPHLQQLYEGAKKVAQGREGILSTVGKMTPEAAIGRIHAPGQLIRHGEENLVRAPSGQVSARLPTAPGHSLYALQRDVHQSETVLRGEQKRLATLERRLARPTANGGPARPRPKLQARVEKQRASVRELAANVEQARKTLETKGPRLEPAVAAGDFRVPYTPKRAPRSHERPVTGPAQPPGQPRLPGSVTKRYTGGLLKSGNFRDDVTRVVGESYLEAQRLTSLLHLREQVKAAAKATPGDTKYDVPMRLDKLKRGGLSAEEQALIEKITSREKLDPAERARAVGLAETVRSHVFPQREHMSPEEAAAFEKLHAEGKIGWVDSRLLRGMGRPAPRMEAVIGRPATSTLDAINNAARLAIFYLKPAYAIPNLLGNTALTLIHQGFVAPKNLLLAARLNAHLGPELTARIDELMGEGVMRSLAGEQGVGQKAIDALSGRWSKVIDTPFRRAAFLHEAARAGYRTPEQIAELVLKKSNRDDLVGVTRRSNSALIDYADMTPREREFIRRIVFVYPWVKGSTKYAGHFLKEHPVQAGVYGQLGAQAYERNKQELGPFPSYAEGAFRVGGSDASPLISNPTAAALFQTPAQLGAALAAGFTGHPLQAAKSTELATPGATLIGDMLAQKGVGPAAKNLVKGLPQAVLAQRIWQATHGQGATKLYPPSVGSAVGQFGVGGIYPHQMNRATAAKSHARERQRR